MDVLFQDSKTVDAVIAIGLLCIIGFVSLRFEMPYAYGLEAAARHPAARFVAGAVVVGLSLRHPILAVLALIAVFFWIADVHMLSTLGIPK